MLSIDALFCHVDDFCQTFEPLWRKQLISHGLRIRQRRKRLCLSEIMTILIVSSTIIFGKFVSIFGQNFPIYPVISDSSNGYPLPSYLCVFIFNIALVNVVALVLLILQALKFVIIDEFRGIKCLMV